MAKYYHNGHYIKLIPDKYDCIENIGDFLEELDRKRLTGSERENLQGELLRLYLEVFVDEINRNSLLRPHINGAIPSAVVRVRTKEKLYHAVKFSNGVEVRCKRTLYLNAPVKTSINRLY